MLDEPGHAKHSSVLSEVLVRNTIIDTEPGCPQNEELQATFEAHWQTSI